MAKYVIGAIGGALIAISTLTLILFALRDAARAVEQETTTEAGES